MVPTSNLTEEGVGKILPAATILLILFAIVGRALPGIVVGPINFFGFRLYLYLLYLPLLVIALFSNDVFTVSLPKSAVYLLGFLGYAAFVGFWAVKQGIMVANLFILFNSVLLVLCIYLGLPNRDALISSLLVLVALVVLTQIIAGWEFLTGQHLPYSRLTHSEWQSIAGRFATAIYWNRNDYGLFLGIMFPLFASNIFDSNKISDYVLNGVLASGILTILALNQSRAGLGMIAVGASIIAYGRLYHESLKQWIEQRTDIFTGLLIVFTIGSVAIVLGLSNPFEKEVFKSLWVRWQLQTAATMMLFETVLGVGAGNFSVVVDMLEISTAGIKDAHNWLFMLLAEFGVVGTTLFLLAYGTLLDRLFFDYVDGGDPVNLILFASLFSFLVGGIGPSSALVHLKIFWVIVGLAMVAIHRT